MEHKYSYRLSGKIYFVCLTAKEKCIFEDRYGVVLSLAD